MCFVAFEMLVLIRSGTTFGDSNYYPKGSIRLKMAERK